MKSPAGKELAENWVKLPYALLQDETISVYEAITYSVLLDQAKEDPNLNIKISQSKIARLTGFSLKTVQRTLIKLEEKNLVLSIQTNKKGDTKIYHLWRILPDEKSKRNKKKKEPEENVDVDVDENQYSFDIEDYKSIANDFDGSKRRELIKKWYETDEGG